MDNLYSQLEAQVKALIQQCENLKRANSQLNQVHAVLIHEKELLLSKHKTAIAQIEAMVTRLKSIENSYDRTS